MAGADAMSACRLRGNGLGAAMRQARAAGHSVARVTRRAALISTAALLTAACGERQTGRLFKFAYDRLFGEPKKNPMTRAQIEENPYASIEMRVGPHVLGVLILIQRIGPDLEWRSPDLKYLHTRSWRLVKTAGLPINILRTEFIGSDPVAEGLQYAQSGAEAIRIVDFSNAERFGRVVRSRFQDQGEAPIRIVELDYPTRLMREDNHVEIDDWEFTNYYWYDPATGIVWRSIQHVDPAFDPLEISILKPPATGV